MEFNTSLLSTVKKITFLAVTSVFIIGCSSTQNIYDEDGIYNSSEAVVSNESDQKVSDGANTQVYKNYFEKGVQELSELEEDGAVFTDIESYSSEAGTDIYVDGASFETNTGYAAWGDETQDVEITIYNNNIPYWRGFGFGYGGFGNGFGFPNPYGIRSYAAFWSPWGMGFWNTPHYGYGNFGYGYYRPFVSHGHYNYGTYNGARLAYNNSPRGRSLNTGRRSSAVNAISSSRSRLRSASVRTSSATSRNTYSRNRGTSTRVIATRPTSANRDGVTRGRPTTTNRDGVTRGRPTTTNRDGVTRGRPVTTRPSRPTRPSGTQSRPSRPVRPSGTKSRPASSSSRPTATPSRSSSRSSSASRSSSPSRSSSGSSSRSSGRSGGRRG
ncbi:hypothetical protein [uncultured Dokdonia sp.]|uniref:hypothetical protein n=1 Tax=Dokdonia sp. R78006 TaxID=3093866 RepID=UPI00261C5C9D|nr:hypothetical protein [uncultured Dokdonia sp.]